MDFPILQVDHKELKRLIKASYRAKRALFVQGPPRIGKSYTVREAAEELAKELGLKGVKVWPEFDLESFNLLDIRVAQHDPVDFSGLPQPNGNRVNWLPPDFLSLPPETKGLYFFDEINLAPPLVQSALYSIILDRRISTQKIPEGMGIVAAGNRLEDNANVFQMAEPLKARFLRCELRPPTVEAWTDWALSRALDARIVAFIKQNPSYLFRPKEGLYPALWEFASDVIKGVVDPDEVQLLAGAAVGAAAAAQLAAFTRLVEHVSLEKILQSPDSAPLPEEVSERFALVAALVERYRANPERDLLDRLMIIATRLPAEFSVLLLRGIAPLIEQAELAQALVRHGLAETLEKYLLPVEG